MHSTAPRRHDGMLAAIKWTAVALLLLLLLHPSSTDSPDDRDRDLDDIKIINSSLGTRSPYPAIKFSIVNNPPSECVLKQVQLVSRHGTRYPTADWLPSFYQLSNYLARHHDTLKETSPYLANWTMPFNASDELTQTGRAELDGIATRLRLRHGVWMSSLLDADSAETLQRRIIVRAANKSRVVESAEVFTNALFAQEARVHNISMEILDRKHDADLVPHESCKAFKAIHSNISSADGGSQFRTVAYPLRQKRGKSPEAGKFILETFPLMADKLSRKLRIPVSLDLFISMLEMCGNEVAIFNFYDGFCKLFSTTDYRKGDESGDLDINEIADDLRSYYEYGYGAQINQDMMCSLVTDIFESAFHLADENPLILRFTHAETMLPLASALGLFHDEHPLTADYHPPERVWKSSFVAPYSSNLQLEVYDCTRQLDDPSDSSASSGAQPDFTKNGGAGHRRLQPHHYTHSRLQERKIYSHQKFLDQQYPYRTRKVRVLWNEQTFHHRKLIRLPGCQDEFCSLATVYQTYEDSMKCNYDKRCGNEQNTTIGGWTRF
ncbi:hypothetical protein SeMB42_g03405 [Synchytrium endobioticum]|uniref:Multiple inositol polyphosphate phosphatase 1 n=1 Tax=Synchytrium endobioticum TaxID=286115 RepID=A0A507DFT1_9FUNG|nr:hypothetical protein SeMB42_g03405 [Synchytrium endobioticum]TPX50396.1 hypothetical protein SeLEV6574_g00931 [Synchytrium endobioticum]